jgi:hypothetical protein
MVQTYEQKVELLKKARLAKIAKRLEREGVVPEPAEVAEEVPEKVKTKVAKKAKPAKVAVPERTLNIPAKDASSEEEVIEERIEVVKVKKPKRLVKKVIQQVYESDSEEEIMEEVIVAPKRAERKPAKTPAKPFEIRRERYNFNF